jgi:predicted signal transduction protein with EAL and GGDEF domain
MRYFKPSAVNTDKLVFLLRGVIKTLPYSMFVATLLLSIMIYHAVPLNLVISWFCLLLVVASVRLYHAHWALKHMQHKLLYKSVLISFVSLTMIMGACWGMSYFLFVPHVIGAQEFVIILILGGLAAGSIASLSIYPIAYSAYIIPMLAPIVVFYLLKLNFYGMMLAGIFTLFILMLLSVAKLNSSVFLDNINLHIEKDELIQTLRSSNLKLTQYIKEVKKLSITDPLTLLYNRRFFDDTLKNEVGRLRRNEYELSLLLIDIDNFKQINDRKGHPVGDKYLKWFAQVLMNYFKRSNDTIFRVGGDEFAIIIVPLLV